jgi:hypothetical protein
LIVTRKDITIKDLPAALILDTVIVPMATILSATDALAGDKKAPPRAPSVQPPTLIERIKADPDLIFREGLQRLSSPEMRTAIYVAIRDTPQPVTEDQLRRLYRENRNEPNWVLADARSPEALLRETFAEVRSIRWTKDRGIVENLLVNPRLPRDILAAIAADPKRFGNLSDRAKAELSRTP